MHNIHQNQKDIPKFSHLPPDNVMIDPQWLKLPMPRTNLHVLKDGRVIEV